jgi:hypothetical protein
MRAASVQGTRVVSVLTVAACLGAAPGLVLATDSKPPMGSKPSVTDILNFALNLECIEGEFYSWAAFGKGLTPEQLGGGPPSIGGRKANLSEYIQGYAEEIARDEIAHVDLLRSVLGDAAVPCPKMDIGPAFAAAADAAVGEKLDPQFDPYENDIFFLHGAFIFEDVGVTAYHGAVAPLFDVSDGPGAHIYMISACPPSLPRVIDGLLAMQTFLRLSAPLNYDGKVALLQNTWE